MSDPRSDTRARLLDHLDQQRESYEARVGSTGNSTGPHLHFETQEIP